VFASNDKRRDLAQVDNGYSIIDEDGGIVYMNGNDMTLDAPLMLMNLISFFTGMYLRYNDGKGMQDVVKFLCADFVGGINTSDTR